MSRVLSPFSFVRVAILTFWISTFLLLRVHGALGADSFNPPNYLLTFQQQTHLATSDEECVWPSDHYLDMIVYNRQYWYGTDMFVGTPSQKIFAMVDTGSCDMWVADRSYKSNFWCSASAGTDYACYSPDKSSTYRLINDLLRIKYVDLDSAQGVYAEETITFFGTNERPVTLANMQFGLAHEASYSPPLLGLGPADQQSSLIHPRGGPDLRYDSFSELLQLQNHVQSNVISIALNHHKESYGKITFGAIDVNRFRHPLVTLPMLQSEEGDYWGYNIRMDGVFRVDHNDEREELGASDDYHALLDTGFTHVHVPDRILSKLAGTLSRGYINRTTDQLYASCIYHSLHKFGGLEFHFGNAQIMVPWDALFYPPVNNTHSVCESKLSGSEFANKFTLGMPFYQHSYVVHDLDLFEVSLAPATSLFGPSRTCVIPRNHTKIPYSVRLDTNNDTIPMAEIMYSQARKREDRMQWFARTEIKFVGADGSATGWNARGSGGAPAKSKAGKLTSDPEEDKSSPAEKIRVDGHNLITSLRFEKFNFDVNNKPRAETVDLIQVEISSEMLGMGNIDYQTGTDHTVLMRLRPNGLLPVLWTGNAVLKCFAGWPRMIV